MNRSDEPTDFRITLWPEARSFRTDAREPVLSAALRAAIHLPHSCKGGSCGLCRARVLAGTVSYPFGRPSGLTAEEQAQGYALLCEAHAESDLTVDIREIRLAGAGGIRRLPCRLAAKQQLAPDVMALFLRLPLVEAFEFLPGQYVDVMLPGARRRSFSLANPPHERQCLELHVRRAPGGEFSRQVFTELEVSSLLDIEGPLGQFCYRHDARPALLIGGGTGFAPLKSMIRHVLERGPQRALHLYWGARTQENLYEHRQLCAWSQTHRTFRYTPVLSQPDPGWKGRTGWVHEAAFADHPHLRDLEVYAAGPPEMIEAVKRDAAARGLPRAALHFDSFEYAPDALQKIRHRAP